MAYAIGLNAWHGPMGPLGTIETDTGRNTKRRTKRERDRKKNKNKQKWKRGRGREEKRREVSKESSSSTTFILLISTKMLPKSGNASKTSVYFPYKKHKFMSFSNELCWRQLI